MCALTGPNGAGKTTMLRCVIGPAHLSAGQVWLDGRPHPDPAARSRVAPVPEVQTV